MLMEQTIEKLNAMRLRSMANAVRERLARPDHADLSFSEMFGLVVDDEWIARENRNLERRMTSARFKDKSACIEGIDYHAARGLKKTLILELAQNHWIEKRQNLLLTGPAGVGKSFLAQALGQQACRCGFGVAYLRLPKFLQALVMHRADGSHPRILRQLAGTRVLILDDWGIPAIGAAERADLLEILEDRYSTGSTIITSQLPVAAWHAYVGGGIVADAVCDRLLHNGQRIELKGDSQRAKTKTDAD
jgi:DNA replication protein DnaC